MKILLMTLLLYVSVYICEASETWPDWENISSTVYVTGLAAEGNYIWAATHGGLLHYNKKSGEHSLYDRCNSGLISNKLRCVAVGHDGTKWIGSDNGLLTFKDGKWWPYPANYYPIPSDDISCIEIAKNGEVWIGTTNSGVAVYNGKWTVFDTTNSGLPQMDINCIYSDYDGSIWIGTKSGGAAHFINNEWEVFSTCNSGLLTNDIRDIIRNFDDILLFATYGAGVSTLSGDIEQNFKNFNEEIRSKYISSFCKDSSCYLYIGTKQGYTYYYYNIFETINKGSKVFKNRRADIFIKDRNNDFVVQSESYLYWINEDGVKTRPEVFVDTNIQMQMIYNVVQTIIYIYLLPKNISLHTYIYLEFVVRLMKNIFISMDYRQLP